MTTAEALRTFFESDRNSETIANIMQDLCSVINSISQGLIPAPVPYTTQTGNCREKSFSARDAAGVNVTSLTESVMGVTAGLVQIAKAINNLADAVRESGK